MDKKLSPTNISSNTRRLLGVNFVTFALVALAFVLIVVYFRGLHTRIFVDIEQSTAEIVFNSKLRRSLSLLEVEVQEFINQVLRKPEVLNVEKTRLLQDFQSLILMVGQNAKGESDRQLLSTLTSYYGGFAALLEDYTVINDVLGKLRKYQEDFSQRLALMGENAGRLMVDQAVSGQESAGLQQTYLLVPLCQEKFFHGQVLIDASVLNNDPSLLGISRGHQEKPSENTAAAKFQILRQTLQTLTSADPEISEPALLILQELPAYLEQVGALHDILEILHADWQKFEILRNDAILEQEKRFAHVHDNIGSLKGFVVSYDHRLAVFTIIMSVLVFAVSLAGFLLSRKLGSQLEDMAEEAIRAKELAEATNIQLQQEVAERRQAEEALRESRDLLEQRVRERTAQLAASNRLLQEEIDIRFKAEEALAAEKERLAVTLRSIGDGVIATDREGRIVLVNKVAEGLTGWTQEEALGRPLQEVYRLVERHSREPVVDLPGSGRANDLRALARQNLLLTRDGRERLAAYRGTPIMDRDSQVVGNVVVFSDISEQEKIEAELLKVRKLESVGILAGGIAHDFNNILAAILGNINLALMSTDPDDRRFNLLSRAEKASLRAKDLTQQLLTFSKGGEPVKLVTSISEIIQDSAEFVLRGSKSKCHYRIPDGLWPVEIDPGQISQVVQNITLNASQAMPDGGIIEISCDNFDNRNRSVPVTAEHLLRLTIKDSGQGIPPDQLDRVFDPYFTTKKEGSGLGLAITHSIITKHGGQITVASEPGQDTTFTIYLAAASQDDVPERPVACGTARGSGLVLVMDDEEMVREIAREMLIHLGYEVLLAKDGSEVIDYYRQYQQEGCPIDVFLVDLTIPGGMGGRETVEKLRQLDPGVKAVVSSGYSNDPVVANYRDYGFVGVVDKPFQINELAQVIHKVMQPQMHNGAR
jgi:PAS domain S-box-containing protein